MKLLPRIRRKPKPVDTEILAQELNKKLTEYYNKEELKEYLDEIRTNERKRNIWDSLSALNKVKLLRFVLKKKQEK